jgi:hypothetical protein
MTDYERKKIDIELRSFVSRHLKKPASCHNREQIRFYISELAARIEALQRAFHYAPEWAYSMLAQYNERQNSFLVGEFRSSYC